MVEATVNQAESQPDAERSTASKNPVPATLSSEQLDHDHGPVSPLLPASAHDWLDNHSTPDVELRPVPRRMSSSDDSANHASLAKAQVQRKPSQKTPWPKVWLWEILSAVFSLLCLGAVIAILAYMDKKLLDDWHFPISPNALVSIFMTLAKSAMLLIVAEGISQLKWVYFREQSHRLYDMLHFDNASRGPWGAAELMWSVRWHAVIASIGAFITIVALAMDPFTQQVIAYETTNRNVTGVAATIRNARSYDDRLPNSSGGNDIRGDLKMQLNVTAAIFSGISQATQKVAFTCGTGNCTWPIINTLGICSSCQNLTGTIKPKCSTPTYTETCNITYNDLFVQASNKESQPGPQWTTSELTLLNISSEYPLGGNDSFNGSLDSILAVLPNTDIANDDFPSSINTYSCNLSLCQKSYNSTVINGTLIESLVSTSPLTFPLCGLSGSLSSTGNTWLDPTTEIETCPGFLAPNSPPSLDPENRTALLSDPNVFWINAATLQEMRIFIRDLMSNQSTSTTTAGTGAYSVDKSLANMLYYSNSGNFIRTMDGIAEALSNNVIRHGPNATWEYGTAQVPTTRLKVLWVWLTLPIGLVLGSVVFLAIVIAFSSGSGGYVWKSSILATVFHRLEGLGEELDKRTLDEMESTAKGMRVRLGEDVEGNVALLREGDQDSLGMGKTRTGLRRRWFR